MIVRLIAQDPRPRVGSKTDLVVYQVPEKSREIELIQELFDSAGIVWTILESQPRKPKEKSSGAANPQDPNALG